LQLLHKHKHYNVIVVIQWHSYRNRWQSLSKQAAFNTTGWSTKLSGGNHGPNRYWYWQQNS